MNFEWIAKFQEELRIKVLSIQDIWHAIGIEECRLQPRKDSLSTHVLELLDEMYEEEFLSRQALVRTIEDLKTRIHEFHMDLQTPELVLPSGKTLLITEKILYDHYKQLTKLATTILDHYRQLRRNEESLATRLGEISVAITFRHVPTKQQLQNIQSNLDRLNTEKQSRLQKLDAYRQNINQLYCLIGDDSFQKSTLMIKLLADNVEEELPLTHDFLDNVESLMHTCESQMVELEKKCHAHIQRLHILAPRLDIDLTSHIDVNQQPSATFLKELNSRLNSLEKLRQDNLSSYLANCCADLRGWWSKCLLSRDDRKEALVGKCFILGQNADSPTRTVPPEQLEALLSELDFEISKWTVFYEQHRPLFEAVHKWQETFDECKELETKRSDPTTMKNRGGILLTVQRQYNIANRELKRCELLLNNISLEPSHRGVRVNGMPVDDFVTDSHRQYEEDKENYCNPRMDKTNSIKASRRLPVGSTRISHSYSAQRPGDKRQHRNIQQRNGEGSTTSSCFTAPVGVKKSRIDWSASTVSSLLSDKLTTFQPPPNPFLDFMNDYSAQHGPLTSSPILRVALIDCNDQQRAGSQLTARSTPRLASRTVANTLGSVCLATKSSSAKQVGQQVLPAAASSRRDRVLLSSNNSTIQKAPPTTPNNQFRTPSGCPIKSVRRPNIASTPRRSRVGLPFR